MIFTEYEANAYCLKEIIAAEYCSLEKNHEGECRS